MGYGRLDDDGGPQGNFLSPKARLGETAFGQLQKVPTPLWPDGPRKGVWVISRKRLNVRQSAKRWSSDPTPASASRILPVKLSINRPRLQSALPQMRRACVGLLVNTQNANHAQGMRDTRFFHGQKERLQSVAVALQTRTRCRSRRHAMGLLRFQNVRTRGGRAPAELAAHLIRPNLRPRRSFNSPIAAPKPPALQKPGGTNDFNSPAPLIKRANALSDQRAPQRLNKLWQVPLTDRPLRLLWQPSVRKRRPAKVAA